MSLEAAGKYPPGVNRPGDEYIDGEGIKRTRLEPEGAETAASEERPVETPRDVGDVYTDSSGIKRTQTRPTRRNT